MWKIVDKTKKSFDSAFEHVAFTNDESIVKAFREFKDYEVTKVNLNIDVNSIGIEVYARNVWYEVLVPNTTNKYVTFRLASYFNDYESANKYIGGQYTFRTIHNESDMIISRASELY